MNALYSISIKRLIWLGFALVILPLVVSIIIINDQLNQVTEKNQSNLISVVDATQVIKQLNEHIYNLERLSKQYLVLNDESYKSLAEEHRQQAIAQAQKLQSILTGHDEGSVLENLNQQLGRVNGIDDETALNLQQLDSLFEDMNSQLDQLAEAQQQLMAKALNQINQDNQQIADLVSNVGFVIPITLAIAAFFIILITRPLQLLKDRIHILERGDFAQPISVRGSQEVEEIVATLEAMRLKLKALESQKTHFIRHISHELKTPLAAICEAAQLLYDNTVGELNPEQQEIVQILVESASRLQKLIEDLLNYNIAIKHANATEKDWQSIADVLQKVLLQRQLELRNKSISVNQDLQAASPVFINSEHLRVIIDNLVSNAIKYSPEHGEIDISLEKLTQSQTLRIADQGPGIDVAQRPHIFDPFFQGTAPQNTKVKSSGLGLAITRDLVEQNQGQISLEETNHGSVFAVSFSLSDG